MPIERSYMIQNHGGSVKKLTGKLIENLTNNQ